MLRFLTLLVIGLTGFGSASADQPSACISDREQMLSLDYSAFDQDPQLGWRSVADRPECRLEAADLLRAYHERLQARGEPVIWDTAQGNVTLSDTGEVGILYWHEGQLRAMAGQYAQAAALFQKSLKPADKNYDAWNQYALGSIAFLGSDHDELVANRNSLARSFPESLNLRVLDRLIRCFGKPYVYAYSAQACAEENADQEHIAENPCPGSIIALLGPDYRSFNSDTSGGGWRFVADKEGCKGIAADLIKTYRETKIAGQTRSLLHHEAQLRGAVGDYAEAIALLEEILETEPDISNRLYHQAEIAFFRRDKDALLASRTSLATLPKPDEFDGGVERFKEHFPDQRPPTWPINLDVVDGLINCFDKPYSEAYSSAVGHNKCPIRPGSTFP
jgi:tetratricopeptide (TPR) repeat protein